MIEWKDVKKELPRYNIIEQPRKRVLICVDGISDKEDEIPPYIFVTQYCKIRKSFSCFPFNDANEENNWCLQRKNNWYITHWAYINEPQEQNK